MSKKGGIILTSVLVAILSISFLVSAQINYGANAGRGASFPDAFQNFWDGTTSILNTILKPILGDSQILGGNVGGAGYPMSTVGEVLFIKSLFAALIFIVVFSILISSVPLFSGKKGLSAVVGIIVSILSVRFLLTAGWIETILLPTIVSIFFIPCMIITNGANHWII